MSGQDELPKPTEATDDDLRLAVRFAALGADDAGLGAYGGMLACALAGIYAEREKAAAALAAAQEAGYREGRREQQRIERHVDELAARFVSVDSLEVAREAIRNLGAEPITDTYLDSVDRQEQP